ncbi:hypothetical protein DPMN_054369 [Dreissena polymorpha]|uniref:Uncharacterized protein n=1 Tax=Dreissena polymorpha TaxID=45954 RepID=A0A9D4HT10_DREPO|nr:hypothetical protein DPMN_054369 [Dreissena polymorpha]
MLIWDTFCTCREKKMNFEALYRVEVYKNKGGAKNNEWSLGYKFEDILFGSSDMSNSVGVVAVKLSSDNGQRVRFLSMVDLRKSKSTSISHSPGAECLVAMGDTASEAGKLKQVLERSGVMVTERKKRHLAPLPTCVFVVMLYIISTAILQQFAQPALYATEKQAWGSYTGFTNKDSVQDLNRLLKMKKGEQGNAAALGDQI